MHTTSCTIDNFLVIIYNTVGKKRGGIGIIKALNENGTYNVSYILGGNGKSIDPQYISDYDVFHTNTPSIKNQLLSVDKKEKISQLESVKVNTTFSKYHALEKKSYTSTSTSTTEKRRRCCNKGDINSQVFDIIRKLNPNEDYGYDLEDVISAVSSICSGTEIGSSLQWLEMHNFILVGNQRSKRNVFLMTGVRIFC